MYNFVVQLFVLLILWEVLKLLIEKRKGEHKRYNKKLHFKMELMETSALIFSPNAKKSPRFMEEYTLLAKEKNYAEEHCKGFC